MSKQTRLPHPRPPEGLAGNLIRFFRHDARQKCLIFLIVVQLISLPSEGQRYSTNTGEVQFSSETPVENIQAVNKKAQVVVDLNTGQIAARIPIKSFEFPNKLMQEHFNENYMESDKYPVATFAGTINGAIKEGNALSMTATGKLTIHGVAQDRELRGTVSFKDGQLSILSDFEVALTDHQIAVPKLVFVKIAQIIKVRSTFTLQTTSQ